MGEFSGDSPQCTLVNILSLFFSNISATYHQIANDPLCVFPGRGPGQGFFVLVVDVRLWRATVRVDDLRAFGPSTPEKLLDEQAAAKGP